MGVSGVTTLYVDSRAASAPLLFEVGICHYTDVFL